MKRIFSVLMAAIILMSLASCAKRSADEAPEVTESDVKSTEVNTNTSDTEKDEENTSASADFYKTNEKMFEINSKHCSVQFPEKWKDMVEIKVTETETAYQISFYAVINCNKIPLYTFVFGDSAEGYLLGRVSTEKGEQDVFLIDLFSEYKGGLSEADEFTYYEMSEGVNHIISKLVYDNGMVIS